MLTVPAVVVAHPGQPPAPHDLWGAWHADPVVVAGLLLAGWAYARARARGRPRAGAAARARGFAAALLVLGVALLSPLDALAGALASAHMVQHVLLVLVAAPLLAWSAPPGMLLRAGPAGVRRLVARTRGRFRLTSAWAARLLRHPAAVWLLHVATLWSWHAAALYDAALRHPPVHALEHGAFLLTGLLFWRTVVGPARAARVPGGLGVMLVFAMALQSTLLALLLTFAREPWYAGYATTTAAWGLEPLADQQLAGVIMWVPAGLIYLIVALGLLATWVRASGDPGADESREAVPPLVPGS